MIQRFQYTETGVVAADGTIRLTFPRSAQSLVLTGSVFPAVANPLGTTVPARSYGAIWTALINGTPVCSFQGLQGAGNIQAWSAETFVLSGTNLIPGSKVQASWSGWSDMVQNTTPVQPFVTGDVGGVNLLSPFIDIFQSGPISQGTDQDIFNGSSDHFAYLLGYTMNVSLDQQSTVTGSRSITAQLVLEGITVLDTLVPTTVPGTTANETLSKDLTGSPLALGYSSSLHYVLGATGASAALGSCTVYLAQIP